jgi:ribosomal protein L7/L12
VSETVLVILLILVAGAVVVSVQTRLAAVHRRLDRLSRIEGKLDVILKHLGLQFDPLREIPVEVIAALREGRKIEAIKRYREATGAGLAEAKDQIEEALRRERTPG